MIINSWNVEKKTRHGVTFHEGGNTQNKFDRTSVTFELKHFESQREKVRTLSTTTNLSSSASVNHIIICFEVESRGVVTKEEKKT